MLAKLSPVLETVNDFYLTWLYHNPYLTILLIIAFIVGSVFSEHDDPWGILWNIVTFAFLGSISITIVALVVTWPLGLGYLLQTYQADIQARTWLQALITFVLLGLGTGFYFLKRHFKWSFGVIEMVGGATTVWVMLGKHHDNSAVLGLAMAGGVYLCMKGIEDFVDGRKKDKEEGESMESPRPPEKKKG